MSRVVLLHVGAPKTGTTYVQDRLDRNARSLAKHGVQLPAPRWVPPSLFHFRAALDLLGEDWGGPPGHAKGAWSDLVRRIGRADGVFIVSHEILAPAAGDVIRRAVGDLRHAGAEVHVVYSARDLGRQLPAAWQESVKQGHRWSYKTFLTRVEQADPWFKRAFDLPEVLSSWGAEVPTEHLHVVTVPQRSPDIPRDELWHRFCRALRIDPAWAPADSTRSNRSMGAAETEIVRQLNKRLDRRPSHRTDFDTVVKEHLAQRALALRDSAPVGLPPRRHRWATRQAQEWLAWLAESGVEIVGDSADLVPAPREPGVKWQDPRKVSTAAKLSAAMDGLESLIRESAECTESSSSLPARLRRVIGRGRGATH